MVLEAYSPLVINPRLSPQSLALMGGITYAASQASHQDYAAAEAESPECVANLKVIGVAIFMHASDHDEGLPEGLDDVLQYLEGDTNFLSCPGTEPAEKYLYVKVANTFDVIELPHRIIMAFDKRGNHRGGRNVLFVDGHVEWMSEKLFQIRWAEQKREYNLPSLKELGDRIEEE
jgi:prepilin-type processing-associated H-X9-DG protein